MAYYELWHHRNKVIFEGMSRDLNALFHKVIILEREYQIALGTLANVRTNIAEFSILQVHWSLLLRTGSK